MEFSFLWIKNNISKNKLDLDLDPMWCRTEAFIEKGIVFSVPDHIFNARRGYCLIVKIFIRT